MEKQLRTEKRTRRAAWKKPQADSARLDGLLDHAAVEFNARGIAGARLARVAAAAGIGRAALYYYVDSREDLAFRCYQRACRTTAADLAEARSRGGKGLRQLEAFLQLSLDAQRAPSVVLSEVQYLGGEHRSQIETQHERNMRELRRMIAEGIEDGSIRACDAGIVAQGLFGMLCWVPLAGGYVEGSGAETRQRAAQALWDLVENGTSAGALPPPCPLDFGTFVFRPGNVFDRRDAAQHKIELLLQTASYLFNRRGIDGTSLDDITAALGATKGAFYHHLPQKRALVVRCAQRAFDFYERFAEAAGAAGGNGLERAMFGLHLNVQAQASAQAPLSPLTGLEALPAAALRSLRKRAAAVEQRFEKFNRAGIADGSLRDFDVRTLSLAGAGCFGWIPKWRDPDSGPAPRAIADEMVALFALGLRSKKT